MADHLVDTFTDTSGIALENHTPDVGSAWSALGFEMFNGTPSDVLQINSNTLGTVGDTSSSFSYMYRNATDPGADEYTIEFDVNLRPSGPQAQRYIGVGFRMTPTGTTTTDVNRYLLYVDNTPTQAVTINSYIGGVSTTVATAALTWGTASRHVRIEVTSTGAEVFVDGVSSLVMADTSITQRGRIGVGMRRANSNQSIDNLTLASGAIPDPPAYPGTMYRFHSGDWQLQDLTI